jgi:hypothetical protein
MAWNIQVGLIEGQSFFVGQLHGPSALDIQGGLIEGDGFLADFRAPLNTNASIRRTYAIPDSTPVSIAHSLHPVAGLAPITFEHHFGRQRGIPPPHPAASLLPAYPTPRRLTASSRRLPVSAFIPSFPFLKLKVPSSFAAQKAAKAIGPAPASWCSPASSEHPTFVKKQYGNSP